MKVIGNGLAYQLERALGFAEHDRPVLISGPTGTGKELIAKIYADTWCATKGIEVAEHYVIINCGLFTDDLLRSELFGHVKGSFSGADKDHAGLLEKYRLICLDELGDASESFQTSLLRLAEYGDYLTIGAEKPKKWQGRLIACTNKPDAIRLDLRHRFHDLVLPPLVERPSDIIAIVEEIASEKGIRGFTSWFVSWAVDYDWPGNVRELLRALDEAKLTGVLDIPTEIFTRETGHPPNPIRATLATVTDIDRFGDAFLAAGKRRLQGKKMTESVHAASREFVDAVLSYEAHRELHARAATKTSVQNEKTPIDSGRERSRIEAELRQAGSLRAYADSVGRSESTVRGWVKRLGIDLGTVFPFGTRRRRTR